MSEQIVLDPSEVASGRSELDITPWIGQEGIDWGDSEIQAYMAEQQRGSSPVDYRTPNRTISGPLSFVPRGGTSGDTARGSIQAKIARLQAEGGWLKRVTASGGTVFADVVNATLHATSVSGWQSRGTIDPDASFTLEVLPDFYGAEITLSDHVETSAAELVFTETSIQGDYPGRCRIVVDEDSGNDQRALIWSFRSRHYDSAATAAPRYEAEALQPLDTASKVALSGASGGTVVRHSNLAADWTPVLGTNMGGTAFLTHTGTYRVFARCHSTSGTTVQARLVWDVGDLVLPAENTEIRMPGASNFYILDLGEVRLDQVPVGSHRWQAQVQAKGDAGGEAFSVDRVWIVNSDEAMGRLTAPTSLVAGLTTYSARDEFNQSAGTLTGKTLPVGGTWVGAGDSGDYSVTSGHVIQRTTTTDTQGRYELAGTATYGAVVAELDVVSFSPQPNSDAGGGLILRYTDTSNWFKVLAGSDGDVAIVRKSVGGVVTTFVQAPHQQSPTGPFSLRVYISRDGLWKVWIGSGNTLREFDSGTDADLSATGTLATGRIGIVDQSSESVTPVTRTYDNFAAWVPAGDAVPFASSSAELRWDGHFRQVSGGTVYGPVSFVTGDLARIPPSGPEGRTVEGFVKASRGNLDDLPDSGIDDISARVTYRPSWLFAP